MSENVRILYWLYEDNKKSRYDDLLSKAYSVPCGKDNMVIIVF